MVPRLFKVLTGLSPSLGLEDEVNRQGVSHRRHVGDTGLRYGPWSLERGLLGHVCLPNTGPERPTKNGTSET